MMQKLKFGILGGTRGIDSLYRVFLNHPYAEVSAICENFEPLRNIIKEEVSSLGTDCHVFANFDDMLNSGIDAVLLANYANQHAPYAIKALRKKIHVFSESIPTQTMKEAVELCEAVEESGALYGYGENYCYLPHLLAIKDMFDRGELGNVMHMEGNFINDCSMKWHLLTRGDASHWRNHVPSTFYCTHSIGPMLFSTGLRSVMTVGMETNRMPYMAEVGARSGSGAMEIMQLDNGGMAKSINGNYRRTYSADYRFITEYGTVESDPYNFGKLYISKPNGNGYTTIDETHKNFLFKNIEVFAANDIGKMNHHEKADVYQLNIFIQSILGNADAKKYMIDVYRALDMSTVGTLAYHSILNGNVPVRIPNMRIKEDREPYKYDNRSTDEHISKGAELLPSSKNGFISVDNDIYERVKKAFYDRPITSGGK